MLAKDLPELLDAARRRLTAQYGITPTDAETLWNMDEINGEGITYFEQVVCGSIEGERTLDGKKACNWYVSLRIAPCRSAHLTGLRHTG
jgi:Asp-tRNA(Asn)/Glu-tRNA(Gln) amidotransferase B subunit